MKKLFICFILFLLIFFFLPALLTKKGTNATETSANAEQNLENTSNNTTNEISANNENDKYDYKNYATIKLLHKKTGVVEDVSLDDYLVNVVSAEMPADFDLEALKAQAVVARTYTIYKINNKKHDNANICDDSTCCQAWVDKETRMLRWEEGKREENWNKIIKCVKETQGQIITYEHKPINAFFHSNSGGKTEVPVNVWGGTNFPYLQAVETAGEEGYTQYSSEIEFTKDELIEKLKSKYNDIKIDFNNQNDIKIMEYTDSGRVKTIRFGNHSISGVEARTILGLKSTNFEISKIDNKIKFSVKGYGHGVGMSQTGADAMAKQGKNYQEIIRHFYSGIEIENI